MVSKKKSKSELKENEIKNLGQKIKEINKIPDEDMGKIYKNMFISVFTCAVVMFVFIFILIGQNNIPLENYIVDLKFFSIIAIAITICIFEYGYKMDSGFVALIGTESLIVWFIILSMHYVLKNNIFPYRSYLLSFMCAFIVYYLIKTIIIYYNEKHKYRNTANDIKGIIEKDT